MKISKRLKWILAFGLAVSAVVELAFVGGDGHGGGPWHHIPLFDFGFGFLSCWVIVVASKAIGHSWLQRPEAYYSQTDDADAQEMR